MLKCESILREASDDDDPRIPGLVSDWIEASGVYWKESAVVNYLKQIYATENIVKNPRRVEGYAKGNRQVASCNAF